MDAKVLQTVEQFLAQRTEEVNEQLRNTGDQYTAEIKEFLESAAKIQHDELIACGTQQQEALENIAAQKAKAPVRQSTQPLLIEIGLVPAQVNIPTTDSQGSLSRRSVDPPGDPVDTGNQSTNMQEDHRTPTTQPKRNPYRPTQLGADERNAVRQRNRWEQVDFTDIQTAATIKATHQKDSDQSSQATAERLQRKTPRDKQEQQAPPYDRQGNDSDLGRVRPHPQDTVMLTPTQLRQVYPHLIIEERVKAGVPSDSQCQMNRTSSRTAYDEAQDIRSGRNNLQLEFDEEFEKAFTKDEGYIMGLDGVETL
jgi:hypothetical protein